MIDRRFLLFPLLLAGEAWGWEHEEWGPVPLPARVLAVETVEVQGKPMVLALGAQVSWLIDPRTGDDVRTLPIGGRDIELVDVDGDGLRDLLVCGPAGVQWIPWDEHWGGVPSRLSSQACDAIEAVDSPWGPLVATAGDRLVLWQTPGDGTLLLHEAFDLSYEGRALLAGEGDLLAASAVGASEIFEWSAPASADRPSKRAMLAAGGPVGGTALGAWGWSWSLTERALLVDMTHREIPLDAEPGPLTSGDVDRDGQRDLAVLHPSLGLVTLVMGSGGLNEVLQFTEKVAAIGLGDVDLDGCDDLVVGMSEPSGVTVLRGTGCEAPMRLAIPGPGTPTPRAPDAVAQADPDVLNRAEVQPPEIAAGTYESGVSGNYQPAPPVERPAEVLGVEMPWFLGDKVARDSERMKLQQYVVVGSGWAMGGALRNVWLQIPFFPALSVEMELGGPRFRYFLGGDSAALFLWMTDNGGGIHLANVSTGFTFGSPRLRTGPFITAGLLNAGAGWRTVFTPWDDGDTFKGLEFRLTWFQPATGEVMILYVWSQPMKQPRARYASQPRSVHTIAPPAPVASGDDSVAQAEEEPEDGDVERLKVRAGDRTAKRLSTGRFFACRSFGASVGVAVGGSSTRYSWEYVGSDVPVSPSVSPMIAMQCETGGRGVGLLLGAEAAPFYSYLTREDDRLHQMGSHTLGLMFGGDGFRIGPTGTVGIWTLGGGLRAAIRLKTDRQGLAHQLDIRAMAHYPSAPAGQLAILYGVALDPWR